jgi:hypothetical protein
MTSTQSGGCSNPNCQCTNCTCGPDCSCGTKPASASTGGGCSNPNCTCGPDCSCGDDCTCGS